MLALILAQVLSAAPAPVIVSDTHPRTLADVARERKLGKKGVVGGTLSVAGVPIGTGDPRNPDEIRARLGRAATSAQDAMEKAVRGGTWTNENIHYNEGIKEQARQDWDNAAENCRKTPGCVPVYRDGVGSLVNGVKPLRTTEEILKTLPTR